MWLILMIGVGLLGLVIERALYLFQAAGNASAFMSGIQKFLKTGDFDKAIKFASSKKKMPLAKAVVEILSNRDRGTKAVQKAVDEVFLTETPKISKNIPMINILANISTMLGLMGTIFGLMMAFDAVANAPAAQRATELAKGISVAMSTTLFGLVVAVPGILAQGILSAKSDKVVEDMDEKTSKLINLIQQ
jgi:biopolymer transport protein ExbB/TolQ